MEKSPTRNTARHTRDLTKPLLMEDAVRPRTFVSLVMLSGCFIAAVMVWASIAQMKNLTVVTGSVKIAATLPAIQNHVAGRLVKRLVHEGQVIDKDTPLIQLKPSAAIHNLKTFHMQEAKLLLRKERLEAVLQNRQPQFGMNAKKYPGFARQQREVSSQNSLRNDQLRTSLAIQIKNRDVKVDQFTKQVTDLRRIVEVQSRQLKIRRALLKQGVVSREAFWETHRLYKKNHRELSIVLARLKSGLEALNEARTAMLDFNAAMQKKRIDEYVEIKGKLGELKRKIALLEERSEKLFVRASVGGVVLEMLLEKTGEIIDTGRLVAKIMPLHQELNAEIRLAPDEMNRVNIGQQAHVKIIALDDAHLGDVKGVVKKISVTTERSKQGGVFHTATIALNRNYISRSGQRFMIHPGMMARVLLVSGAMSLTDYLLKPIYRSGLVWPLAPNQVNSPVFPHF